MLVSLGVTILAIMGLTAVSAFFSGSEIAIFSLDRHRLATLDNRPGHRALSRLRADPHRLLVTILVSNNFVNIAIATLVTGITITYATQGTAIAAATLIAGTVVLVFGEIAPKSYGVAYPERVALTVARPVELVQTVLAPVVWIFEQVTGAITTVTGGGMDIERPYVTREEIIALVRTAEAIGEIEDSEHAFIQRLFRFNVTPVGQIMKPRGQLVTLNASATVADAIDLCSTHHLARLPVTDQTTDRIDGYVDLRDLLTAPADSSIAHLVLPAVHVYDHRESDEVFAELRESGSELAVVHDKNAVIVGHVSLEDLVEEIVGELYDSHEHAPVTVLSPTTASVDGTATIREVNDAIGSNLPSHHGTIAALLTEHLHRLPRPGDRITIGDTQLTIRMGTDGHVHRVHVELLSDLAGDASGNQLGSLTRQNGGS